MPYADVNGQRICYEDSGGDGPPVIFSHGFLMDREMFAAQVAALSPEYRVVTWDERGFGETEFDGEPFTYWDSARDCLGLLDQLGIGEAVLGGMSQGGFLSLRAALLAPDRVRALDPHRHAVRRRGSRAAARVSADAADVARAWSSRRPDGRDLGADHRRSGRQRAMDREVARAPPRGDDGADRDPVQPRGHRRSARSRSPAQRSCSTGRRTPRSNSRRGRRCARRCLGAAAWYTVEGAPARVEHDPSRPGQRAVARVPALALEGRAGRGGRSPA